MLKNASRLVCCIACIIVLLIAFQYAYAQDNPHVDQSLNIRYVSIINLIANPSRYHDATVRVIGHMRTSSKGTAVYLTRSDASYEITKNGLWVNFDESLESRKDELDLELCGVVGTFNANDRGPQGLWNGSFTKVIAIGPLNKE